MKAKPRPHWARMNPDESPADYALRVTNDGRIIATLAIVGAILIIAGLVLAYRPL